MQVRVLSGDHVAINVRRQKIKNNQEEVEEDKVEEEEEEEYRFPI